jgi:hypothetical protein
MAANLKSMSAHTSIVLHHTVHFVLFSAALYIVWFSVCICYCCFPVSDFLYTMPTR